MPDLQMAHQTSRLDRLLTLLDTGSTPATRRAAARQIGDIAKLHCGELRPVLRKVRQFLRSHKWETRVAAAQAVGAIAENVKHISVKELIALAEEELAKAGFTGVFRKTPETGLLKTKSSASLGFSSFDIQRVLEHGASLLASGGQEFDVPVDTTKTPAERLALQKQGLNKRLGLDVCERFMDMNDIIVDEDLVVQKVSSSGNGDTSPCGSHSRSKVKQEVHELVARMVPNNLSRTLSARERNKLKRKAKVVVRDGSKEWGDEDEAGEPHAKRARSTKSVMTEQSQGSSKLVVESVLDEDASDFNTGGQWPFEYFVELLIHDIFDPVWELRHGSMMALREILSAQAGSAAVVAPVFDAKIESSTISPNGTQATTAGKQVEIDLNLDFVADEEILDIKDVKECVTRLKQETCEKDAVFRMPETPIRVEPKHEQDFVEGTSGTVKVESLGMLKPEWDLNLEVKCEADLKKLDSSSSNQEEPWCLVDEALFGQMPKESRALKVVTAAEQAWGSNLEFLQDCTIRLLCIFALDRFGDFVSDQVVAPVRETCAQALGAVLKQMPPLLVHETLNVLLQMQGRPEWEVRHGSLLGIKYMVAVRQVSLAMALVQEMLAELLPRVLPACMAGLEDRDDDVRAVAAEALTPAAVAIASSAGKAVSSILLSLWEILLDLDDLSPSTSSAMNLLAELYSQPESITKPPAEHIGRPVLDLNEEIEPFESGVGSSNSVSARDPFLLATLAPRLWPFMRHNISSVRHAAIRTFERLLESGGQSGSERCSWAVPILGDALQLVFQNLLLETHEDILHCSERVWRLLLKCPQHDLATAATTYFSAWLKLASTAIGTPLETSKLFCHFKSTFQKSRLKSDGKSKLVKASPSAPAQNSELSMGATSVRVIVGADGEKSVVHMRVTTSLALGILAASLPQSVLDTVVDALSGLLASNSSVQRQVAAMVLVSWFQEIGRKADGEKVQNVEGAQRLRLTILELLSANDAAMPSPGSALPYIELSKTYEKMRNEAGALVRHAETLGIAGLPAVERMTAEQAISLVMKLDIPSADASQEEKPASNSDFLVIARQRLLATAGYLKCLQSNMHISVLASLAGAVVWMGVLPTKLNPVIQPLMAAVKREQAEILQQPASFALAEVIGQCVGRKPSPNDKLIKNLCALTCADPMETPQASTVNADNLLYANGANQSGKAQTDEKSKNQAVNSAEERAKLEGAISRHGAELAFKALSVKFGDDLFEKLPKLWDGITEALGQVDTGAGHSQSTTGNNQRITPAAEPQALINNLQVVRSICPALSKTLQMELLTLLPAIFSCVHHQHAAVRLSAARCLTSMARTMTEPVMAGVLAEAVPMLRDTSSIHARQGAGMLVTALVEGLGSELVPYAPLLIVPLLGCMSDSNEYVRQSVTHSFATLVPLLPLARGMPSPRGLDDGQALRRAEDTRFLEQLLDNSQVDDYTLRVPLSVTLRRYQQEGINWLAFLKRFKLHGILCDDMGLGKTLQASAIVASDTAEQVAALGLSGKTDGSVWPSLIVCPSTLVGHWAFEIEKFIEKKFLNPLQYIGSPQDRLLLRSRLHEHNVVITSYDVLRKDVEFLSQQLWNYCVLDEGHVIKSAKSKITLAAKRIQAEHRLILSGTPIQNNVLELWSLFDFLMPGFLGTERQFYAMYGKPLSAAREAKCSGKDTEAGILAMEALHKQVMPFLLRRTKDEVLADLPPKIIQDRYCDMSPLQLRLYEDFSKSQVKKQVGSEAEAYLQDAAHVPSSSGSQPTHVFQALQYLKKLCSHPLLVLDESPPEYVASIISAPHSRDTMAPLHELHHAPKLLALQEILEECGIGPSTSAGEACLVGEGGQHRVLIFAQFKAFLDIIEKDLFQAHMKGVTYLRLDGSVDTDKRFEIVKTFNSDPTIDVLLLTTHVGGLGLNLTAADTVVFMEHDWNPMRDLQAMDRAHRLGQRRVVNVHRLIMRGTLEEKVMSLQQFKMSIFNNVITAENVSLSKMDTTRLLDLFTVSAESGKAKAAGRSSTEVDAEGAEAAGAPGGGKGLKALLNGLDELWDQSQYTEEYNLSQFLTRLNN